MLFGAKVKYASDLIIRRNWELWRNFRSDIDVIKGMFLWVREISRRKVKRYFTGHDGNAKETCNKSKVTFQNNNELLSFISEDLKSLEKSFRYHSQPENKYNRVKN